MSTFAIVLTGMITTFATLVLTTFLFGELLFGLTLIKKWVPVANPANAFWIYGKIAVFVASIGMFIAALGATFESNRYFRHITFVDEEI